MALRMMEQLGSWVGDVPDDWSVTKLKHVARKIVRPVQPDDGIVICTNKGTVVPRGENNPGLVSMTENGYQEVLPGDLCIHGMDTWHGAIAVSNVKGKCTSVVHVCESTQDKRFLAYYLRALAFRNVYKAFSNGVRQNTSDFRSWTKAGEIPIVLPDLRMQRRIADYLDARCADIDAAIRAAEKSIEDYKAFRDVSISTVAIHGLRNTKTKPSGVPGVGNIPADWGTPSAGILFSENVRPALPNDQQLTLSQTDGLIPTAETITQGLRTGTYENWRHVIPGDLVLNRFKAHLGVFFASKYTGMVSFHYGVFVPQQSLNVKYYEYLFHSDAFRQEFALSSNGVTVGLQNLSNTNFYHTRCLLPPIDEQNEIVDYLDRLSLSINGMTSAKQSIIADLKAYKQSLVYEVATGKREVS
jgi:type I restriction enzyme, S subunit